MSTGNHRSTNGARTRVAVVTGGAASIGQACAVRLARDGYAVAIADLDPATETAEQITQAGGQCLTAYCDVTSPESVAAFAEQVDERFGGADTLFANAGIYPIIDFKDTTWEDWRRIMSINVDSLFHLTKAFLPGMVDRGWGRIICVSSTTFHVGTGRFTAYTASKGAVIGFVRALATDVGNDGVTVNAIAPSIVRTKGTLAGPQQELGSFEITRELQAIHRTEEPEDLAGAVSFLASDDAAFITGQTLPVCGGLARA